MRYMQKKPLDHILISSNSLNEQRRIVAYLDGLLPIGDLR
jgi:hypothetical protein